MKQLLNHWVEKDAADRASHPKRLGYNNGNRGQQFRGQFTGIDKGVTQRLPGQRGGHIWNQAEGWVKGMNLA
ncbi:MAG: hypothetical protein ACREQA_03730 [Candidatus Binatia bacterium]